MDKVVLISGANGFLGKALVSRLVSETGICVVATDLQEAFSSTEVSDVSYCCGDLNNETFLQSLNKAHRFDVVIHLAGILSKGDKSEDHHKLFDANCKSTLGMLELARSNGSAFIFPSTGLVYGDQVGPFTEDMPLMPGDFYAQTKLMCEGMINYFRRRYGLRSVVFRPAIIYGPAQRGSMLIPSLARALLTNCEYPMTPGEQKRDFVYIDDIVDAFCLAIHSKSVNGVFNLGSGVARTIISVAQMTQALAGKHDLLRPGAIKYRDKEVWEYCLDCSKAQRELNWKARTDISLGLNETLASMKERLKYAS